MGSTVLRPNHGAGSETLVTRRDAAEYITEHADEWQAAMPLQSNIVAPAGKRCRSPISQNISRSRAVIRNVGNDE
jgi:hypothetical protein